MCVVGRAEEAAPKENVATGKLFAQVRQAQVQAKTETIRTKMIPKQSATDRQLSKLCNAVPYGFLHPKSWGNISLSDRVSFHHTPLASPHSQNTPLFITHFRIRT